MLFRDRPFAAWALPLVTLLVALVVLGTDAASLATRLRGALFDGFIQASPRPYEAGPVKVVDIDPASSARFGTWPWSHGAQASLIDAVKRRGAAVVAVVGRFERPDPLSARQLASLLPPGTERQALEHLPSPDAALISALDGTKSVTGFALGSEGLMPKAKAEIRWSGRRDPLGRIPAYSKASGSLPVIEAASEGVGALTLRPDADGRVRRMPLLFRLNGKTVPSLDAEVLRLKQNKPQLTVKSDNGSSSFFGGGAGVAAVETPQGALPTSPDMWPKRWGQVRPDFSRIF